MFGLTIIKTNKLRVKNDFIEILGKLVKKQLSENEVLKIEVVLQNSVIRKLNKDLKKYTHGDPKIK